MKNAKTQANSVLGDEIGVTRHRSSNHEHKGESRKSTEESGSRFYALHSTLSALLSIRVANRNNCHIFEPWTPARDAFAEAFYGEREPHLNELWAMSEAVA